MKDFTYMGAYCHYDGARANLYGVWEAYKDDTFVGRAQTKKEMKQIIKDFTRANN